MNHDEFMSRVLQLEDIDTQRRDDLQRIGQSYLDRVRDVDATAKALSICSYEDGELEAVFRAFLRSQHWGSPLLQAFRHFLTEHIRFDSDVENGHGALSRHFTVDDRVLLLWTEFKHLLVASVPQLSDPALVLSSGSSFAG